MQETCKEFGFCEQAAEESKFLMMVVVVDRWWWWIMAPREVGVHIGVDRWLLGGARKTEELECM
jgi:hypothetical protein